MKFNKGWILPLILTAATGAAVWQSNAPASKTAVIDAEIKTPSGESSATATEEERCAYTWANREAPELTGAFASQLANISPEAEARVVLFGEECAYSDGRADFQAMEADFYARIPAEDLNDENAIGDWMAETLSIVEKMPHSQVAPAIGFVEFWFAKSNEEQIVLRVPFRMYMEMGKGKRGAEFFRLFNSPIPY